MNPNAEDIKERFYFCYLQEEAEYFKENGFYYITKAIHPKTKKYFSVWDKSESLMIATQEFQKVNKR
jgi:hypothetical protein